MALPTFESTINSAIERATNDETASSTNGHRHDENTKRQKLKQSSQVPLLQNNLPVKTNLLVNQFG